MPILLFTAIQKKAAELLAAKLKEKGCPNVVIYDLARDDMSAAVADAFRYSKLVLATLTTMQAFTRSCRISSTV